MSANPVLPPELTDRIIDYLHDDNRSLSVCSLVYRSWLPTARYHRFDMVVLKVMEMSTFQALLDSSPAVANVVSKLSLEASTRFSIEYFPNNDPLSIISRMPHLRHLRLVRLKIFMTDLQCFTSASNLNLLNSLSFDHCRFSSYESVIVFVSFFSGLRHLSMYDVSNGLQIAPAQFPVYRNPHLEELHLEGFDYREDFHLWLTSPKSMVKSLSCTIENETDSRQSGAALRLLGESIERLEIVVDSDAALGSIFKGRWFSLEPCTKLRHCNLSFRFREMCVRENQSLPWVINIIAQASSSYIETLTVKIEGDNIDMDNLLALDSECGVRELSVVEFDQLDALDWELLVEVLSSEKFATLSSITFIGKGLSQTISAELKKKHPMLERILLFSTSERSSRCKVWS